MLTRMSTCTFDSMARFTAQVFNRFEWDSVSILYNENGLNEIVPKFCFLAVSAIVSELSELYGIDVNHDFIDLENIETMLKEDVGSEYSSKHYRVKDCQINNYSYNYIYVIYLSICACACTMCVVYSIYCTRTSVFICV